MHDLNTSGFKPFFLLTLLQEIVGSHHSKFTRLKHVTLKLRKILKTQFRTAFVLVIQLSAYGQRQKKLSKKLCDIFLII